MAFDPHQKMITLEDGKSLGGVAFQVLWTTLDNLIQLAEVRIAAAGRTVDSAKIEAVREAGCSLMRHLGNLVGGRSFDLAKFTADATAFAKLAQEMTSNG